MLELKKVVADARDFLMPNMTKDVDKFMEWLISYPEIENKWNKADTFYGNTFCEKWKIALEKHGTCYVFIDVNFKIPAKFKKPDPELSLLLLPLCNPEDTDNYVAVLKLTTSKAYIGF